MKATLLCDESGNFGDDADRRADSVCLVGGLVATGRDQAQLARDWEGAFVALCAEHGVPAHAAEIHDPAVRQALLDEAAKRAAKVGALWLCVRAPTAVDGDAPLALYLRTLEAWVDLGARLAAVAGASSVDVLPAQRTVPLSPAAADRAKHETLGKLTGEDADSQWVQALVRPGIRVTFEQLGREADVSLGELSIVSATSRHAHPGLALCDQGCFALRHAIRTSDAALRAWPEAHRDDVLAVSYDDAAVLRRVARDASSSELELVRLAERVAKLEARASANVAPTVLLDRGALRVAERFYRAAIDRWSQAKATPPEVRALVSRMVGAALPILAAKRGSYEGVWRALSDGWAGDGPLARRAREVVQGASERVVLWRLVMECANHRGDVATADRAWEQIVLESTRTNSLATLAELLLATNVRHVSVQNRLPASDGEVDGIVRELEEGAELLQTTAELAAQAALAASVFRPEVVRRRVPDDSELFAACGASRSDVDPDLEVGRCFGTVARTRAFLGRHEEALALALRARCYFGDEAFDLSINAVTIVRILCDEARRDPEKARVGAIRAALAACGAGALVNAANVASDAVTLAYSRFVLDALLRAILWSPKSIDERVSRAWMAVAQQGANSPLHSTLKSDLTSHPSELVARHLGELAKGEARRQWLALSVELSERAADGGTIRRFAAFGKALLAGLPDPTGPAGGLLNPTFEYR